MQQAWELYFQRRTNVADAHVKRIEVVPLTAAVGDGPTIQTTQPVRRIIVGPPSLHLALRVSPAKPNLAAKPDIDTEFAEIDKAWRKYRSTNSRNAVYIHLSSVFAVVTRWRRRNCAVKNSQAALRLRPNPPQMKPEPFAIVIFCTADSKIVDDKTRSKWSRVLRYAARTKPEGQRLIDFIKSHGGINECARKFGEISE
jgi:hypothetical protein